MNRTLTALFALSFALVALAPSGAALAQTNYPGYGYAEPGYQYRVGVEVERNFLQAFWQRERRTFEREKEFTLSYTAEFAASLTADLEILEILKVAKIEIGGKIVTVFTARVRTRETLETECTVKYEKTKVWYQISRAKKQLFGTPAWEVCGKTYKIVQEATGEEVQQAPTGRDSAGAASLVDAVRAGLERGDGSFLHALARYCESRPAEELRDAADLIAELNDFARFAALDGQALAPGAAESFARILTAGEGLL